MYVQCLSLHRPSCEGAGACTEQDHLSRVDVQHFGSSLVDVQGAERRSFMEKHAQSVSEQDPLSRMLSSAFG